jgi:multidrug efflux pump subunit AcrA (membrane-fusion protein)
MERMNASAELLKELRIDRKSPPPASSGGSGGRRWLWIAVAVIIVLLAGGAFALFGRAPTVEVDTAPAVAIQQGSASSSVLDASGYVVARRMATVSAKITGKVREVMIEEGMRVEQGQIMATLDPIDADAQRNLYASQLQAARSQVVGLDAQQKQAAAEASRLQALVGQQLVSRSQYDQAVAQRDSLRAQLETARRNVKVANDQLSIADLGVDNNIVRAPFSGVVTAKAAQPGEIVSPLSAASSTWNRWRSKSRSAKPSSAACSRRCRWKPRSTPTRSGRSRPR